MSLVIVFSSLFTLPSCSFHLSLDMFCFVCLLYSKLFSTGVRSRCCFSNTIKEYERRRFTVITEQSRSWPLPDKHHGLSNNLTNSGGLTRRPSGQLPMSSKLGGAGKFWGVLKFNVRYAVFIAKTVPSATIIHPL